MLVSQKNQIKSILNDGHKHCSTEFVEKLYIIDYRRRICDLKDEGLKIKSEPCHGECGRNHTSSPFRYWIEAEPVQVGLFAMRKLYDYETR
jgi:hypothetical protein